VKKRSGLYPRVQVDAAGAGVVSQAGAVVLVETARSAGLDRQLSQALARWRRPVARHDPGKVVLDLAVSLAVGGDCLADIAVLRGQPRVFGPVASDPTVSRTITALAADAHAPWPRFERPEQQPAPGPGSSPSSTPPTTTLARPRRW